LSPNKTLWEEINMAFEEAYEELESYFGSKNRAVKKALWGDILENEVEAVDIETDELTDYFESTDVEDNVESEIEDNIETEVEDISYDEDAGIEEVTE
jgi:DNA topoisomerase VI subunit B